LAQHLQDGNDEGRPPSWHRLQERRARSLPPVPPTVDLEDWERELAWMELLVLSGSSDEIFVHFARAWGQEDGFHLFLSQFVGGPAASSATTSSSEDAMGNFEWNEKDEELAEEEMEVDRGSTSGGGDFQNLERGDAESSDTGDNSSA